MNETFAVALQGKSAGFLTPDSELELHQLMRRFGKKDAARVWEIPATGVSMIVKNIKEHNLHCDLQKQDSVFLGIGKAGHTYVTNEAATRSEMVAR